MKKLKLFYLDVPNYIINTKFSYRRWLCFIKYLDMTRIKLEKTSLSAPSIP